MKLIALDDGHGKNTAGKRTPYIKSLGREIRENEFNEPVVDYLKAELQRCGFKTILTAPTDADTPLAQRVAIANNAKADLFISIHFNAFDGTFAGKNPEGFSAHIDPSRGQSEAFAKLALKHLAAGTKQVNRGLVLQQLYVTANTKMPAVLFELGFMDNEREALLMLDKNFQKECAKEIAMAVCEYYKVKYVPEATAVKTPSSLVKIGTATMLQDVHVYAQPKFGTQTGGIIKKGEVKHIYAIKNGWYQLFGGEYIPSNYGKNFDFEPVPSKKPEPPKVASKPAEEKSIGTKDKLRRVVVDGKRIGSFGDEKNLERNVLQALKKDFKKIEVEDV